MPVKLVRRTGPVSNDEPWTISLFVIRNPPSKEEQKPPEVKQQEEPEGEKGNPRRRD